MFRQILYGGIGLIVAFIIGVFLTIPFENSLPKAKLDLIIPSLVALGGLWAGLRLAKRMNKTDANMPDSTSPFWRMSQRQAAIIGITGVLTAIAERNGYPSVAIIVFVGGLILVALLRKKD